jgi:hypothetical protein
MFESVPDTCTLPSTLRPLRVAEFDELFRVALHKVEQVSRTRLRLVLDPRAEATARDLTAREAQCCSFFAFELTAVTDELALDVVVPPTHAAVLDALCDRAETALAAR